MVDADVVVVGGGIVGLATARALLHARPGSGVVVLEKEDRVAGHQTGHNSGVIHSGVYYQPGSLKARTCAAGRAALLDYCEEQGVDYDLCGKVIVATSTAELPRLENLLQRGLANGVQVERIDRGRLRELEPHARGIAGLHVPSAGIVDFVKVSGALAAEIVRLGGQVRLNNRVTDLSASNGTLRVTTDRAELTCKWLVNAAGLHSDRMATLAHSQPGARIVPFRGEYYELSSRARSLVRNLLYPVPDPAFPFLGVHFTRMLNGGVHVGPNAVLALAREGYRWSDINPRDVRDVLRYGGFWRLAARHYRTGGGEVLRSLSKRAFVRALQRLVPDVRLGDLVASPAGVRAQALRNDGALVDDFEIVESGQAVSVVNAPSPAATASLEIGRVVAQRLIMRRTATGGSTEAQWST